jgi:MerR family transcriptional regulator, thiopeptide resistance regulator
MARKRLHRVKELAELAGVSVRTLHHYDELGLLVPSARTDAGYRLYDDDDLLRLQQILIGRELGLSLEVIRRSLDRSLVEPGFDRRQAVLEQRRQLAERARRAEAMLRAVDAAVALIDDARQSPGGTMDMKRIFDGFEPQQYAAEAERRWGGDDAYQESKRRTSRYSAEDWKRQATEQAGIYDDAFRALQQGKATDDDAVLDIAERHRLALERWFYPCSHAMHARLADLYEQDERFAQSIDKGHPGLTPFLAQAIRTNARRAGG